MAIATARHGSAGGGVHLRAGDRAGCSAGGLRSISTIISGLLSWQSRLLAVLGDRSAVGGVIRDSPISMSCGRQGWDRARFGSSQLGVDALSLALPWSTLAGARGVVVRRAWAVALLSLGRPREQDLSQDREEEEEAAMGSARRTHDAIFARILTLQ